MDAVILIGGLLVIFVVLDLVALRYGADSRWTDGRPNWW